MSKIFIENKEITIINRNEIDFVNLTQMVSHLEDGSKLLERWLNSKNTVDFLGVWEEMYNQNFNSPEFRGIRENVGSGGYFLSVKKWIEKTNAIGIDAKAGKYGGTYAQVDIALDFASYVSPHLRLIVFKEFQRLKKDEAERLNTGWDYRRFLSKTNYAIHTDAIKEFIIPDLTEDQAKYVYPNEADMLNVALFGLTAKQWKSKNPQAHADGLNMRDLADVHQLIVLSNLENNNAYLISKGMPQGERLLELRKNAIQQLKSLRSSSYTLEKIQSPLKISIATDALSPVKNPDVDAAVDTNVKKILKKGSRPK